MPTPVLSIVSLQSAPATPATVADATWVPWEQGRYRETPDGRRTYYIRARVGGMRREVAVADNLDDALSEWALFRTNPAAYVPPRARIAEALKTAQGGDCVRLDSATLEEFLTYCKAKVDADEMSKSHAFETLGPYLKQWGLKLRGRDLHKVTLDELQAILRTWDTAKRKRIVSIKSFARWARTEKASPKLRRAEDPTLDLVLPRVVAEKKRRKKGYEIAYVEEFYRHVYNQTARDMLRLRAFGNGMHDTEIQRIAAGKGELRVVDDPSGIYGVVVFHHKKKRKEHAVSLDRAAFEAAQRLQQRKGGALSRSAYHDALHKARIAWHGCKGQPRFFEYKTGAARIEACPTCPKLLPNELRHSFATWARTNGEAVLPKNATGVSLDLVAEAMGHGKNTDTTAGFYVGDYVPVMIRIPIKLEHPDDPK